ncbi:hypothetical protein POM88_038152 [Heracleum sosnowskyi]|uniref:Uncharacterized protein n=1 Tax=Heracleum sosnowskyi TaxID=360622 RepID=A0AAD8MDX2_9APIA|nr:hypothetical protein POM88_038152 [Heracleum sosnowskyi]
MVEPRRRCFSLPAVELRKKAVRGILYVTGVSANKLSKINLKGILNRGQQSVKGTHVMEHLDDKDILKFVLSQTSHRDELFLTRHLGLPLCYIHISCLYILRVCVQISVPFLHLVSEKEGGGGSRLNNLPSGPWVVAGWWRHGRRWQSCVCSMGCICSMELPRKMR